MAGHGEACRGEAKRSGQGSAWRGEAEIGIAKQARQG